MFFSPVNPAIQRVGQPDAPEIGNAEREAVALVRLVRDDDPVIRGRRLGLLVPEPLGRLHLGRLMLQHRPVEDVAQENLAGDQHGRESHAERDSSSPEGYMLPTQKIPGADSRDEKGAGQIGGCQHVWQAVEPGWVDDDLQPVRDHDMAVLDHDAVGCLHPAVG